MYQNGCNNNNKKWATQRGTKLLINKLGHTQLMYKIHALT